MTKTRRVPGSLALVLAAGLLLSGCGGGGSKTTTLSKKDYAASVTSICTAGKKKIATLGVDPSDLSSFASAGGKAVDLESEQIDKFKRLRPPSELKGQADELISKAETSRDKLKELVQAAKDGDTSKMQSALSDVQTSGQAVHDAASAFGATC